MVEVPRKSTAHAANDAALQQPTGASSRTGLYRALVCALGISAGLSQAADTVDLADLGGGGFRIDGIDAVDQSGSSVSGAGDVNGDGLADLIIGARFAEPAGESYVVFGKTDSSPVDLADLGAGGFRIDGIDAADSSGFSVSGAGDVNGDGLADLIIGALGAEPAGESYVVFGKTDNTSVDLADLGDGGFRIDGIDPNDESGFSVSGAGDVNGDGLADLIIGANGADPGDNDRAGESYVVFGKADNTSVDLADLGDGGFRIEGMDAGDRSGASSGAGDVNGDGLADLIIGAPGGNESAGESYVVFGKADNTSVDLADLGDGGFRIEGIDAGDRSGSRVSGAGDVNGDGLADLVIGAFRADPGERGDAGESYVVFGKADSSPVDLADLGDDGDGGFRIEGIDAGDVSGYSVSGAGDVNGDGLADLIIGAPESDLGGLTNAGESYVVFGKADNANVELASLSSGGFRIDGIDADDESGFSVSGAGDVNGDGLADLIIGAPGAEPGGNGSAGESYVVFSQAVPKVRATYQARIGDGDPPELAVGTTGDGSNASHPDARAWIDFADGADASSPASEIEVNLFRNAGGFNDEAANVSWQVVTSRQDWSTVRVQFRYLDSELRMPNENSLQLVFSPDGSAPFTPIENSLVNAANNTITATIDQVGFFYLGEKILPDEIFADRFE